MNVNTPFMERLTLLAADLIRNTTDPRSSKDGFTPNRPLSADEEYFYETFIAIGEVDTIMKQLQQSVIMLASYRGTKSLQKYGINRFQHIVYHIESHLLRITGVMDRLLILVNAVIRCGLEKMSCKAHVMLHDRKQKKGKSAVKVEAIPGLFNALIDILNFVDQFREDRNEVAHSNRINYSDLRKIEMYHITFAETTDPELLKRKFIVKYETDKKVWHYKAEMTKANDELDDLLKKVYVILDWEFQQHHAKLKL